MNLAALLVLCSAVISGLPLRATAVAHGSSDAVRWAASLSRSKRLAGAFSRPLLESAHHGALRRTLRITALIERAAMWTLRRRAR